MENKIIFNRYKVNGVSLYDIKSKKTIKPRKVRGGGYQYSLVVGSKNNKSLRKLISVPRVSFIIYYPELSSILDKLNIKYFIRYSNSFSDLRMDEICKDCLTISIVIDKNYRFSSSNIIDKIEELVKSNNPDSTKSFIDIIRLVDDTNYCLINNDSINIEDMIKSVDSKISKYAEYTNECLISLDSKLSNILVNYNIIKRDLLKLRDNINNQGLFNKDKNENIKIINRIIDNINNVNKSN